MKKIIVLAIAMGLTLTSFAQKTDSTKNTSIKIRGNAISGTLQPLIVIDGNKQYFRDTNSLNEIDPSAIESITILKDSSAIALYGADGFAGAVQIKTKGSTVNSALISQNNNTNTNLTGKVSGLTIRPQKQVLNELSNSGFSITKNGIRLKDGTATPIYVVDGIEITDIKSLAPDTIESIEILKDGAGQKLYGDKAINGVIIIKTKNAKSPLQKN